MGSGSVETVSTGPTETSCLAVFVCQIKLQATSSNSPRTEIIRFGTNYALMPILAKFRHKPWPKITQIPKRRTVDKLYIDWLDSPIPALDNKTPRQAAKTAKGAQQVRIMIETIPEATGNTGAVTAPKKAMLKELGLEGVN